MNLKISILVLTLLAALFSCKNSTSDVVDKAEMEANLKKVNHEVHEIMEDIEGPEHALKKLAKTGDYSSMAFYKAAQEVVTKARLMKNVEHPEEKFQKFNKEMLVALDSFEAALKTKNSDTVKKSWSALYSKCSDCHEVYE
jgi:cytochrome c556